ncbi:putative carboxylesterase 8 [Forsythia ovata]|uniref:Carboxylesterase 8 n=1 Tax=Forsythia ovata TaxID=205694 RepID=A0ABD1TQI0_9LAMI
MQPQLLTQNRLISLPSPHTYLSVHTTKPTSASIYIPAKTPTGTKLPLIVYLHGGDFVLFSASTVIFHEFCNNIAGQFPAVVASVEYRLAPENRLPAAYDDALNAIFWAKEQALGVGGRDPWLEYADFSRVFIMGSSAGANIAYHVALRALDFDLGPLKIIGLLMNQPFFGGLQRTQSELRLEEDKYVPLYVCDVLWSLALPQGANRDHKFCNPINGGSYIGRVKRLPRCFMKADEGDPMVDRVMQLVHLLQSYGVPVIYQFNRGGNHGMELSDKTAAKNLYDDMKELVYSTLLKGKSRRRNPPTCIRGPLTRRVVNRGMCTSGRDLRERANRPTPEQTPTIFQ